MATAKLPVKTFRLRRRKIVGLILFILGQLLTTVIFLRLGYLLIKSPGRIICAIVILISFVMAIFGIIGLVRIIKEKYIGFFISSDGLNDISTGHNYGVIMWRDVTKIRIMSDVEHPKYKYIVLKVKNPQEYIDRETLDAKKRSMMLKLHYYGSPICFSNRGIQCTFEELESTVYEYYNNFQQRQKEKAELYNNKLST